MEKGINNILGSALIRAPLTRAALSLSTRSTLATVAATPAGTEVHFEISSSLLMGWAFNMNVEAGSVAQVFIPRLLSHYDTDAINRAFQDSADGSVIKLVTHLSRR